MSGKRPLKKLRDLNEHLTCTLCGGYFIDATTIIECLHSFCRSCIVIYLSSNKCCPRCEIPAHKTRPLLNVRSDKTLQDVVNKLVPGLCEREREKKRKFHQETGIPEDAEEKKSSSTTVTPEKTERRVSLSLEYDGRELTLASDSLWKKETTFLPKRYLRCCGTITVSSITKFMRQKLRSEDVEVIIFCRGEVLPETYNLMEVAKTFSWKSDRPLSLTYLTFKLRSRKRKALEIIENEKTAQLYEPPEKKISMGNDITPTKSPPLFTSETNVADERMTKDIVKPSNQSQYVSNPLDARPAPWAISAKSAPPTKPFVTPSPKPQTVSQNGSRSMSYSVMNVPLLEAVTAPVNAARDVIGNNDTATSNLDRNTSGSNLSGASSMSSFVPQQGQERTKSINSIANRLQIQRQLQKELVAPDHTNQDAANLPDVLKVAAQPTPRPSARPHSTWTPTDALPNAKMQRNLMAQRINASTMQDHRRDGMSDTRALEQMQKTMVFARSRNPATSRGAPLLSPTTSRQGNFIQLPHNADPPNYTQATEQQRKIMLLQHQRKQQQARSKYQEIQPKASVRPDVRQALSQSVRAQKHASIEDSQLLTTTRQLASLRQQQKILNEIAAAVRGSSSVLPTSESILAAVSSLSPRMTSPTRIQTTSRTSVSNNKMTSPIRGMQRFPAQQRFPVANNKMTTPIRGMRPFPVQQRFSAAALAKTRSNPVRYSRPGVPRLPQTIGYPSLNIAQDRRVDIYQNTIAKAKAEVREMSMKDRAAQQQHSAQVRLSSAPYGMQRSVGPRKIQPKSMLSRAQFAPSHPVLIAPKMSPQISHSPRMSAVPSYRGITTRPPPPPSRMPSPTIKPQQHVSARHMIPPTPHVTQPVTLPEQEQPLCLVVSKK